MRDEPVEMADGGHSDKEDSERLKLIGSKYDLHWESLQSDTGMDYSQRVWNIQWVHGEGRRKPASPLCQL